MKRNVVYGSIFAILVWGTLLITYLIPDIYSPFLDDLGRGVFIVTEVVASLFLFYTLWKFNLNKADAGNAIIIYSVTMALQLLPFIVRLLIGNEEEQYQIIALILAIVGLLAFLGLYFGLDLLNRKVNESVPKIQGRTIDVVDDSTFYENGKFMAAKKPEKEK